MKLTLQDRLLYRELGSRTRYSRITSIYGDRKWIDDLDIINELGGHTGCVNALSWSKSGRFLASGSDDQHLNIHSYQHDSSTTPFILTTTVATGHTANIFSVKFMPHSNDQTLVTCAGDGEVRVFDIEYSGRSSLPSAASTRASIGRDSRRFNNVHQGVRYLSDGDTNARVYRSHTDRVKRIVTESSPHLFLSCSEDGEVRQWDLRLPSSAYPAAQSRHDRSNIPPPLISYKRYQLDLNTISCSATQPHYIVLGGTHLHCFLHDRRMIGRDLQEEWGNPGNATPASQMSESEDNLMGEATRCVRRFAPRGQRKMSKTDNGHVTACKISDANPNEMIASWSGDHIYSFDLVQTPDARELSMSEERLTTSDSISKVKDSNNRKGKRRHANSSTSAEGRRRGLSQPRQSGNLALRVRYENGQSEDIPINTPSSRTLPRQVEQTQEVDLTEAQKRSLQIAKSVTRIRKLMFSINVLSVPTDAGSSTSATGYTPTFTSVLGFATSCLPEMDEIIREWAYPVTLSMWTVTVQHTLRSDRDSARRFVQASGTLARVLGGRLRVAGWGDSPALHYFQEINPSPTEGPSDDTGQIFSYDFLKAILLWLEGGPQALLQGFKRPPDQRNTASRFPIPLDADLSGIDSHLIPYLLRMARARRIPNVDASRFERDQQRIVFESEAAAVTAFSHTIRIPLEDLSTAVLPASSSAEGAPTTTAGVTAQDKSTAFKYWAFKVGRGLLLNAGEGVFFRSVDRAFGGLGTRRNEDEGRSQDEVDPNEADHEVRTLNVINASESGENDTRMSSNEEAGSGTTNGTTHNATAESVTSRQDEDSDDTRSESVVLAEDLHAEFLDRLADDDRSDQDGGDEHPDSNENAIEEDQENSDGDTNADERLYMWQGASNRGTLRETVQAHVPCMPHTRVYQGHCNVKTVKDVNFFGLQDEYVMSGSDSGHLFIWDKKTSQLVNILEGDGEVVNVMTGHPHEPLLAVSGIDHTIKIFSPDRLAQKDARNGLKLGTSATGSSGHSTLFMRARRHRYPVPPAADTNDHDHHHRSDTERAEPDSDSDSDIDSDTAAPHTHNGLASRKRMHDSYQIIGQNDVERQGGMRDAFITRSVLAQLAARLHARRAAEGGGGGGGAGGAGPGGMGEGADEENVVLVDEDCSVSLSSFFVSSSSSFSFGKTPASFLFFGGGGAGGRGSLGRGFRCLGTGADWSGWV
ncbi:hypothetical protein MMC19_003222 [Ptychographa xylographoides]|nr:hypothetical protein [Ptychographa xylographoides]